MDLSRYASRLNSAQRKGTAATQFVLRDEAGITGMAPRFGAKIGPTSVRHGRLPSEPEDANLTGGTRSLTRRLLALNVTGSLAQSTQGKKSTSKFNAA
jgi:hypothetical protein